MSNSEPDEQYPAERNHPVTNGIVSAEDYSGPASVGVKVYPYQEENPITVGVSVPGMAEKSLFEVRGAMDPEEAREVGQSILDAADEVEDWRSQEENELGFKRDVAEGDDD